MNIKLMRHIDYWIGVPLCFLLSFCSLISKILGLSKKRPCRKILFIKLSELGAIILAYPLMKKIKERYGSSEIYFLTFEKNKDVFRILKGIIRDDNILTIREGRTWPFICDTLKTIRRLRREKIDIAFDLEFFSRFTALLAFLSKAGRRIGFYNYTFEGLYRGSLFTHNVQYNPLLHISKSYLSLTQVLDQDKKISPELKINIDEKEIFLPEFDSEEWRRKGVCSKLKSLGIKEGSKLLLLNAGEGSLPLREWELENFIMLSKRLLKDKNIHIVLVGTEESSKKMDPLVKKVNDKRCVNLAGQTNLEDLMELFNLSEALIANDCGLAHLAALTRVKKFIIFGPESPQIFAPLGRNNFIIYSDWPCSPCLSALNHRNSRCRDNRCLKAVSVDDVYELLRKHL